MTANSRRAFTLVELLVSLAIAAVLLGIIYTVFVAQRRGHMAQEQVAEMQQNGRVAVDELTRAIKGIGNNVQRPGQAQLAYCGPYDLIFNSDVDGDAANAMDAGRTVHALYTAPAVAGGAETYRYSLDRNDDGAFDDTDKTADGRHYVLARQKYYGGTMQRDEIALNLNIVREGQTGPTRLFTYWGDFRADGVTIPWPNPADPVSDLSGQGRALDQMVQRVEITVIAETEKVDPQYAAARPASAGFRQSVIHSNVTPRNLFPCPLVTPAQPTVALTHNVALGPMPYVFNVTYDGAPAARQVFYTLSGPGVATGLVHLGDPANPAAAVAPSGDDGVSTVRINFPDTCVPWASDPAFAALRTGGTLSYQLAARVASSTTPFGVCPIQSSLMTITVSPGPADHVAFISPTTPPVVSNCSGSTALTFETRGCGELPIQVSASRLAPETGDTSTLGPPTAPMNILGTITRPFGSASAPALTGTYAQYSVTYTAPSAGSWPDPSPGRTGGPNDYDATVRVALDGQVWDDLRAEGHVRLRGTETTIAAVTGYPSPLLDCFIAPNQAYFEVLDCQGQRIHALPDSSVSVSLVRAAGQTLPLNQGTVSYGHETGTPGVYQVNYNTPPCTIGPPLGQTRNPEVDVRVTGTTPSPLRLPVNLQSCADSCTVLISPITPCTQTATVTVGGCNLTARRAELVLTEPVGAVASFSPTDRTLKRLFVNFTPSGTSFAAKATLYIWSSRAGDTFKVTSYYPSQASMGWSCEGSVTVSTQCEQLVIEGYNEKTHQWEEVNNLTGQSCLTKISMLRFKVKDCQFAGTSVLTKAITAYLKGDAYTDYVELDLTPMAVPAAPAGPTDWITKSIIFQRADVANTSDDVLTFPGGKSVALVAAYADPRDLVNDDWRPSGFKTPTSPLGTMPDDRACLKTVYLTTPLPVCFPNAITSGGGGGWNGNFQVHWGDVVIQGDVDLASNPKFIEKGNGAGIQFDGNPYSAGDQTDRFFDIYVGKKGVGAGATGGRIMQGSKSFPPVNPDDVDRPFLTGAAGYTSLKLSKPYGNYYQNISEAKIRDMMSELEYDTMKKLAKDRNAYWYALDDGTITNPASGKTGAISDVLNLAAGPVNTYGYNGEFIFIDAGGWLALDPLTSGETINGTPVSCGLSFGQRLPCYTISFSGKFYTKGIIYIAGSAEIRAGATSSGVDVPNAESPPEWDTSYRHNDPTWAVTESWLPIRSDPSYAQQTKPLRNINFNGGLYLEGTAGFVGGPRIYGAISAERGFLSGGNPEIWYNYNLNVSEQENTLCVNCCTLQLDPTALTIPECSSVQMTAVYGAGGVVWGVEGTAIDLSASGLVTGKPLPAGSTSEGSRVKAVDKNNCPAFAQFWVVPLAITVTTPDGLQRIPMNGSASLEVNAPAGTLIDWTLVSGPSGTFVQPDPADSRKALLIAGDQVGDADVQAKIRGQSCKSATTLVQVF